MKDLPYKLKTRISSDELASRLELIVDQIRDSMDTEDLVVVALLKGSFVFMADLIRLLSRHGIASEVDFMNVSSYGDKTESSGKVIIKNDLDTDIAGKSVLLVDDILDTGRTLKYTSEYLKKKNPADLKICTLLDKPDRRIVNIEADIVGFVIPNIFIVGYGLDYGKRHRELPYIAEVEFDA